MRKNHSFCTDRKIIAIIINVVIFNTSYKIKIIIRIIIISIVIVISRNIKIEISNRIFLSCNWSLFF